MQHTIPALERSRLHQPPEQRMSLTNDPHLARQHRTQMLQSVAFSVGVGKTHIAQALAHQAIRAGAEVRFTKTSRALADLAGGHADGTWTRRLRELARPAVLVLDDFAMRELTPAQADDLYELINERAGRSLILTSNRSPMDWYPLFPNPVVAESLLDRLINNSHQLFMNGASYRPHKRPGRVIPQNTATPH
jgi:DNA replication protein DnaC